MPAHTQPVTVAASQGKHLSAADRRSDQHSDAGFNFLAALQQQLLIDPPAKTALVYANQAMSYAQVGQNVHKVMAQLQQQALKPGTVVAVCLPKSPEHVYAVLACALMGIIWLPIDVEAPPARRAYLLANSQAQVVISQHPIAGKTTLLMADILGTSPVTPPTVQGQINDQPAYYLYTSGSTGTPKCVVLNNLATANVLRQSIDRWQLQASDVLMAVTPFHHDMSVFDVLASMALGATLVLPTQAQSKDAQAWADLVCRYGITIWISVPAIVDMLCTVATPAQLQSLRLIAQGGDYIKPSLIQYLRQQVPQARLFSLGGPTETTIWSIWHEIMAEDTELIPYGQALAANQYFILNAQLQPCAVGEVGQMYMAGINLANGYLLDGCLLRKDFVSLACADGVTALRLSDLGYWRADGRIIFAGREEGYLKIKGVRIAAAEVEAALANTGLVAAAVVVCCTHPLTVMHELVAVYTLPSGQHQLDVQALKQMLAQYLPLSHVPVKWVAIEHMTLTANMKVDRRLLQQYAQQQLYPDSAMLATPAAAPTSQLADEVMAIVRACSPIHTQLPAAIVAQTELLAIGLRLQQLKAMAHQIAQKWAIELELAALVRCKTVQDVISQVQQRLN